MKNQSAHDQPDCERHSEEKKEQKQEQVQVDSSCNQQQSKISNKDVSEVDDEGEEESMCAYNPQITINESSINQMLTVLLQPTQTIWYWGEIIASNRPYSNRDGQGFNNFDLDRITHYLKMKWRMPMKLDNNDVDMAYFCIRRRNGGGKILHIDCQVYGETFLWNMTKLLTINHDPINFNLSTLNQLPYLSRLKLKGQEDHGLRVCIQSDPGHLIYQKSLGELEKLYLGDSQILAMSEKIKVKKVGECVALEGPGYVFIEGPAQFSHAIKNRQLNMVVFVTALMGIISICLIIQFLD